ncbi:hypothetical protein HG535_0H02520 [Zygotorulaspora mrakii]|uniref:RING-type E3 ubiquitin transferase n=1 Tax=Zygotorulaspora mrakii TaxID=42260 RepID=A0A7H9B8B7_ZYGMR|nr:uncharacterized protein HG535_0H02520 [Zygotorulaspora mrakii]QLG74925.1 hypothetical protein HG535_0H02520 [Zygotorulaspora mrakii]
MNNVSSASHGSNYRRMQGPQQSRRSRSKGSKAEQSNRTDTTGTWKSDQAKQDEDENSDGGDLCVICAEKIKYVALSPCSHKTCHVCAFRQRALYGKKACLVCRTENESLIFTDKLDAEYDDIKDFAVINEEYGINFTANEIAKATLDLLKYTCSICDSERKTDFGSFKKLNGHLKSVHNKAICMICANNNHAFPSELKIYTQNQLRNHQTKGDSEGFKGHPMCAFCPGLRFYSDDELYVHMRNHHEKCHICEKIDPTSPQYFKDYDQLFEHFKNCHYICTHPTCLENKFVVFRDELELQAHILKEHGDMIRGKQRLFQSELSTFVSAPSRVISENNYFDNSSNSSSSSSRKNNSNESAKVKKLRLKERAKFYLTNSSEKYQKFEKLNEDFDSGKITAKLLLHSYQDLFTSPEADMYLLIHNLSELYQTNSQKFKDLNALYQNHEQQVTRKQELPTLSRDTSSSVSLVSGVWSANNNTVSTSGRGINTAKLPSLSSLPARDPFASPLKSASYKNLNHTRKKSPSPITRTASDNTVNFTPTYLDKKKNVTSARPSNKSQNKLAALDLPTLPTPKPKVYIPPLNRPNIPDPKKWGKQPVPQELTDDITNLSLSSSSSSGRKKGKQKQLLFHIGI